MFFSQFKAFTLISLLISNAHFTFCQERISLEQALKLTLANNLQLKRLAFNEDFSRLSIEESKMSGLPLVSLANNINLNFGRTVDP